MTTSGASAEDLRRRWRRHFEECARISADHNAAVQAYIASRGRTAEPADPIYPLFPEACRGMQCGATTRAGTPCKSIALMINGRCKLHGGMSTGPITETGRMRARCNLARRWLCDGPTERRPDHYEAAALGSERTLLER